MNLKENTIKYHGHDEKVMKNSNSMMPTHVSGVAYLDDEVKSRSIRSMNFFDAELHIAAVSVHMLLPKPIWTNM
jgi:hypothetical protein